VKESLIISKEIEAVIDKENLFGVSPSGCIPLSIWYPGGVIYSDLISANITSTRLRVEFKTKPGLTQEIISSRKILKILIGKINAVDAVEYNNCEIKSLTVVSQGDLYLCRFVVNFGK